MTSAWLQTVTVFLPTRATCKHPLHMCRHLIEPVAPQVDVVHVAVVNTAHRDAALAMIGGGKGVLVEKTFAMNEAQAQEIVAAARKQV